MIIDGNEVVLDQVVMICNGCKSEHIEYPDKSLMTVDDVETWLKTRAIKFCDCHSTTCDVKFRCRPVAKTL